jgi:RNA polymerase sigma factor (sigma-70 family)
MASHPPGRGLLPGLARMGDERLARMVGRGNERAFVTLYERHFQALYRYCRSIVGNDADAQDALQSAFAAALVALRRGARDAPLRPWLFRITHNEAVSLLRRRRPVLELSEAGDPTAPSTVERALERERLALLVADLRELGDRQRGALVMRELSGLSHAEISLALGISVGAAKQAIFEARGALLDLAEGRAMSCEQVRQMISDGDRRVLRARRVRGHMRACADCAAFATAIPARRSDLQALSPPLAPLAATGILGGVLGAGSGHGSGGAGWLAAGAAGKSAGAVLAAKTAVGVAILTTATVGVTHVLRPSTHRRAPVWQTSTTPRGAPPVAATRGQAAPAGDPHATGAAGFATPQAASRPPSSERGVPGHGKRSSKANQSPGRRNGSLHTPVRGSHKAASKPRAGGKPAGHTVQPLKRGNAAAPQGGRERIAPAGGARKPEIARGSGEAHLEAKPFAPVPALVPERPQGPAR